MFLLQTPGYQISIKLISIKLLGIRLNLILIYKNPLIPLLVRISG